jgi:hypothetical protein
MVGFQGAGGHFRAKDLIALSVELRLELPGLFRFSYLEFGIELFYGPFTICLGHWEEGLPEHVRWVSDCAPQHGEITAPVIYEVSGNGGGSFLLAPAL